MTKVVREQAHNHRCVCILGRAAEGSYDACGVKVTSPDQPFCVSCEEALHHEQEQVMDPDIRRRVEENWRRLYLGRE